MPSNSSKIAVAPGFHSFCTHRHENNSFLTNSEASSLQLLMIFRTFDDVSFRWSSEHLVLRTSFLQMLYWYSSFLFVDSIALICSSEPMFYLKTLKFLSIVLHTWTNISISSWHFLIPCHHQNSKGNVKHILFQQKKHHNLTKIWSKIS